MTRINDDDASLPPSTTESGTAVASASRRRALLKGLSKGAALAGSTVPLSSLATNGQRMKLRKSDGRDYLCSVSGNMSVLASGGTAALPVCSGKKTTDYVSAKNSKIKTWPNWPKVRVNGFMVTGCMFGTVARFPGDTFETCFGSGSKTKIGDLIDAGGTDEAYWVCAVLNANVMGDSYPYSSAEVVDQYKAGGTKQAASLSFHKLVAGYT